MAELLSTDVQVGLTDEERYVLYEVGETLVPPAEGETSADEAGVPGHFIDRFLALRPDLLPSLRAILRAGDGRDPREFCEELAREEPERFDLLTFAIVGSYFLNPRVRASFGYAGQVGESQDGSPQEEYLDGGLLDAVRRRGPIYRDTAPQPG
jgi:hypothetical protein